MAADALACAQQVLTSPAPPFSTAADAVACTQQVSKAADVAARIQPVEASPRSPQRRLRPSCAGVVPPHRHARSSSPLLDAAPLLAVVDSYRLHYSTPRLFFAVADSLHLCSSTPPPFSPGLVVASLPADTELAICIQQMASSALRLLDDVDAALSRLRRLCATTVSPPQRRRRRSLGLVVDTWNPPPLLLADTSPLRHISPPTHLLADTSSRRHISSLTHLLADFSPPIRLIADTSTPQHISSPTHLCAYTSPTHRLADTSPRRLLSSTISRQASPRQPLTPTTSQQPSPRQLFSSTALLLDNSSPRQLFSSTTLHFDISAPRQDTPPTTLHFDKPPSQQLVSSTNHLFDISSPRQAVSSTSSLLNDTAPLQHTFRQPSSCLPPSTNATSSQQHNHSSNPPPLTAAAAAASDHLSKTTSSKPPPSLIAISSHESHSCLLRRHPDLCKRSATFRDLWSPPRPPPQPEHLPSCKVMPKTTTSSLSSPKTTISVATFFNRVERTVPHGHHEWHEPRFPDLSSDLNSQLSSSSGSALDSS